MAAAYPAMPAFRGAARDRTNRHAPVLVDADLGGRARKLVVTANRSGCCYVRNRTTGEFLKKITVIWILP